MKDSRFESHDLPLPENPRAISETVSPRPWNRKAKKTDLAPLATQQVAFESTSHFNNFHFSLDRGIIGCPASHIHYLLPSPRRFSESTPGLVFSPIFRSLCAAKSKRGVSESKPSDLNHFERNGAARGFVNNNLAICFAHDDFPRRLLISPNISVIRCSFCRILSTIFSGGRCEISS